MDESQGIIFSKSIHKISVIAVNCIVNSIIIITDGLAVTFCTFNPVVTGSISHF